MALSANTVWEVRTTGNDTNGGGYVSGGTDWSQQDSPQYSVTDAVTNGTTTITSATANFGTDVVGNILYIQGGTAPVTAKRFQIISRTSATAIVVDEATGLTTGTGATLKIGGALATPGQAASAVVAGNNVWVRNGTYTLASGLSLSQDRSGTKMPKWEGYQTARGDLGTPPTISAGSLTSATILTITSSTYYLTLRNFILDGISNVIGTNNRGVSDSGANTTFDLIQFRNCFNTGYTKSNFSSPIIMIRCIADACTNAFNFGTGNGNYATAFACVAKSCGGYGFYGKFRCVNCIAYGCGTYGFSGDYSAWCSNCVAHNNTSGGFFFTTNSYLESSGFVNCIASSNGGYGFGIGSTVEHFPVVNCAGFSNSSGNTTGMNDILGFVALSANPFTNAASGDFSLNTTAGGGAACRAAGIPGVFPGGLTTGYLDIGAAQHQDPAGGGGGVPLIGAGGLVY